jgi:Mg-chelatase subunit ChlD
MAPGGRVEVNAGEQADVAGAAKPALKAVKLWDDWTGGMGDHGPVAGAGSGSGRIYGVDRNALPGAPARTLEISRQSVRAVIRDGLAETEVDQTFANPGGREVEGWYWFTVPDRAVVTSFAVETDGSLVEGEVIEKHEAVAQYGRAIRAAHEPALLEWIDGRSYRARIFPVPASGSRRVVLRYLEMVGARAGKFEYVYPLRGAVGEPVTIGEFSLAVDLGEAAAGMPLSTLADAVVEDGGRKVTMRRSGYLPRADFQLEGQRKAQGAPFRMARFSAGGDLADYVMARYVPDADAEWAAIKEQPGDLVVVVDTSASADDAARAQKAAAAEAVLRALSPADHFALVALDTVPVVLYPKEGLAPASEKEIATAMERLAEHASGGATDLGALFDVALGRVHGKDQPAVVYIGDGLPTSGEILGDKLAERLRRALSTSRARFFTVAVGADANHALLRELSRAGGGQAFRIDDAAGSTAEVLRLASAVKTPTITDLAIDLGAGLDEPMITASGKVARGEEIVLLARTHHALPEKVKVTGQLAGKPFKREYRIELDAGVGAALVPRLWAAEKIRRLLGEATDPEDHRGKVVELGIDYGLVTPFTSILALESEQAYAQQGIRRRQSSLRGVRLSALTPDLERQVVEALHPLAPVSAAGCKSEEPGEERPSSKPAGAAAAPVATALGPRAEAAEQAPHDMIANTPPAPSPSVPGAAAASVTNELAPSPVAPAPVADERGTAVGALEAAKGGGLRKPGVAAARPFAIDGAKPGDAKAVPALRKKVAPADDLKRLPANAKIPPLSTTPVATKAEAPKVVSPAMAQCSDSARRPLAERIVLWQSRLRRATTAAELIERYEGARTTCEVPDFRAQAALLSLVQAKVRTEGAAEALLAHFTGQREIQKFIAQAILRRSVDPRMVAAVRRVLFEDKARWPEIDNELAALATPEDRVARLRQVLLSYPDDPEAMVRLTRALADAKQTDEALALGRRLRERGLMSPSVSLVLGDVLADNALADDAMRTYSEIVEFDPLSAESRRLLGDVYLRHAWYPAAYRQYKTLTDLAANDPVSWLRLAAAASGAGRVDEALRIERQVATAEGTPGPNDPRAWARLLSAARLSRLLAEAQAPAEREAASRKLKELGVLTGPAALVVLTWEDYGAALSLVPVDGGKEAALGEATLGLPVGLSALLLAASDVERLKWTVRWKNDAPGRDVAFARYTLVWDGKAFRVNVAAGKLSAKDKETAAS